MDQLVTKPMYQAGAMIAGRYRLVAPLGSGGMGDVFRATQEPLGRDVALKMIRGDGGNLDLAERFASEARAMAAVRHPNIATVFDFGRCDDGTLFYAMELVPGRNLRDVLVADGRMAWPRVHRIALQVAGALAEIHAVGIVHRDLKPANIMIGDGDGRVTIVDFGLARSASGTGGGLTQVGIVLGTPAYLAPEQAHGRGQIDARADVYSFGVVMYEMLGGQPPFVADTALALLLMHVSEPPPPLPGPAIPEAVDALVYRLLAKDPDVRPRDGRALAALLDAIPRDATPSGGIAAPVISRAVQATLETAVLSNVPAHSAARLPPALSDSSSERPTIAVLPFETRNADDEEFAEGLAQDVITDLSKLSELIVIDSRSSFAVKDRAADPAKLGGELRTRYIVSGNLRRSGSKVRLTVSLTDATTSKALWSERFDRTIDDVFEVQDELTEQIVAALDVKLHAGEQARLWRRSIRTAKGREAFYRGLAQYRQLARPNLLDALAAFRQLVAIEPESALGHAHAAQCHWFLAWLDGLDGIQDRLGEARTAVARALELDPECAVALSVLAHVHLTDGKFDEALVAGRESIALCPNSADVLANFGEILVCLGRDDEALAVMTRALRSSPSAAAFYIQMLAAAYRGLGRHAEAVAVLREAIARYPEHLVLRFNLLTNLGAAGLVEEAKVEAAALRAIDPKFDLRALALRIPFATRVQNQQLLAFLIKGGVIAAEEP